MTTTNPLKEKRAHLVLVAMLFALLAMVWQPTPARAHAQVVSVSPANGTVVSTAPANVSIAFNEVVVTKSSRLQLLDSKGKVVATTFVREENGTKYSLKPKKKLAKGTYALRYSVTSADGHIIVGASSFGVGSQKSTPSKSVTLKSATSSVSLQMGSTVGQVRLEHSLVGVSSIELRHSLLKAPMELAVTKDQLVVLPFPGKWTVTLRQSVSQYQELTYSGYVTVKSASK